MTVSPYWYQLMPSPKLGPIQAYNERIKDLAFKK
jgi:hypothetical protein